MTCGYKIIFNFAEMLKKIDFLRAVLFIFKSKQNMSVKTQSSSYKKSFLCPVCHDTTLDGQVNHWVRNQNGCAVCPTLLGISCGVCGDSSHTTKKCLQKKREDRARRRSMYKSLSDEYGGVRTDTVISGAGEMGVNARTDFSHYNNLTKNIRS